MTRDRLKRIARSRWTIAAGCVAVLVVGLIVALPYALGYGVKSWLRDQGVEDVQLSTVDVNLFDARFEVQADWTGAVPSDTVTSIHLKGELAPSALFSGRIMLTTLVIRDARLVVSRDDDGNWHIAGLPLPAGKSGEEEEQGGGFAAGIDALEIIDSRIEISAPPIATGVLVDRAVIRNLTPWRSDRATGLSLDGTLDGAQVSIRGEAQPFGDTPESALNLRASGLQLRLLAPFLGGGERTIAGGVDIDGDVSVRLTAGDAVDVSYDGTARVKGLTLSGMEAFAGTFGEAEWSGRIRFTGASGSSQPAFRAEGRLRAADALLDLPVQDLRIGAGSLFFDGTAEVADLANPAPSVSGSLSAESARLESLESERAYVVAESLELEGARYGADGAASFDSLTLAGFSVPAGGAGSNTSPLFSTGSIKAGAAQWGADQAFTVESLDLGKSMLVLTGGRLAAESLNARALSGTGIDRLTAEELSAEQLVARTGSPNGTEEDGTELAKAARAIVTGLTLEGLSNPGAVAIDKVMLEGGGALMLLTEEKLLGPQTLFAGEDDAGDSGNDPMAIRIGEVSLGEGSEFSFADETVSPSFSTTVTFRQATVGPLDSDAPDTPANVRLGGGIGKYGQVSLRGTMKPFGDSVSADLDLALEQIELIPLTGYLQTHLGYRITGGQGRIEADIGIDKNNLNSQAEFVLSGLTVDAVSQEAGNGNAPGLGGMPLEAALSTLRDNRNDIRFKVPVRGNIDDPQFDFGGIVTRAIGGALKTASINFLKYTLQPFGAILTVGEMVAEQATAFQLEPLVFEAGQATLPDNAPAYFDKITEVLKSRPQLRLRLCPKAVPADREALAAAAAAGGGPGGTGQLPWLNGTPSDSAGAGTAASAPGGEGAPAAQRKPVPDADLLKLARERADTVKSRLVNDHGIESSRLFVCSPELDTNGDAKPRVGLLL